MSGVDITDTDSALTLASACGGQSFALAVDPDNFTTAPQNGTDCTTSDRWSYLPTGPTSLGIGPATITVTRTPAILFQDLFNGAALATIDSRPPDIGTGWVQKLGPPDIILDGTGEATVGSGGTSRYATNPAPINDNCTQHLLMHGDTGFSDITEIQIRYNNASDDGYVCQVDTSGNINLIERTGGVDTILDTAAFTMPQLVDPPTDVEFTVNGNNLSVLVDGTPTLSATDTAHPNQVFAQIQQTRSIGQPVKLTEYSLINGTT